MRPKLRDQNDAHDQKDNCRSLVAALLVMTAFGLGGESGAKAPQTPKGIVAAEAATHKTRLTDRSESMGTLNPQRDSPKRVGDKIRVSTSWPRGRKTAEGICRHPAQKETLRQDLHVKRPFATQGKQCGAPEKAKADPSVAPATSG